MTKSFSLLAIVLFSGASCIENSKNEPVLRSLVSGDTVNRKFSEADLKRNEGGYLEATTLYRNLLESRNLSKSESTYALLNVLLCEALSNDSTRERVNQDTLNLNQGGITIDIIKGFDEIRIGRSGALFLLNAKRKLRSAAATNSFEYFLTSELLGVNYRMIEAKMDSALYYFKEAANLAKHYRILKNHLPRVLLEIADVCIINRDEITGFAYANEAYLNSTDPNDLCKSLIAKGTIFRKLENYDSAEAYYDKAHQIIRKSKLTALEPQVVTQEILMAIIVKDDSLFDVSMKRFEGLDPGPKAQMDVDRLFGYYYYEHGEHLKSIYHYERALKAIRASQIPDLVLMMEAFYALAEQYAKVGQFQSAEEYAYKSLVYTSSLRDTPYTWKMVFAPEITNGIYNFINYELLAGILLSKSAVNKSMSEARQALTLYNLIDSLMLKQVRVIEEEAILNFLSIGHNIYSSGIEACYQLYHATNDLEYLSQAHHFMERGKGIIMYRDILTHSSNHFPGVPGEFRAKELEMKAKISNLRSEQSLQSPELMKALKKLDDYYNEMIQNYPDYYKAKYELKVPPYDHFRLRSLDNNLTIVQYHKSDKYLYVLTYDADARFLRVKYDSVLTDAIEDLTRLTSEQPKLDGDLSRKDFMRSSHAVFSKIVEPLHISNSTVLIVPDAELHNVPFETLTTDTVGDFNTANYLVREYTFKYAQSLTTYDLALHADARKIENILAYSYGMTNNSMVSLPGTEAEVKSIQKVFNEKSVTYRKDRTVTKSRLVNDLQGSYDLIHIGLHSSSSTTSRLANKIYCSGDNTDELYGFEITPLTIKAHTIVLSSCQSAFGSHIQGEGTYSLARAFRQTGVNTVVSSLWNLTDHTTSDIIGNFYTHLSKKKPPCESLAMAKRQYLSSADEITAHPYFWAAMICQGN
jgi:CHAT domain-containing protein